MITAKLIRLQWNKENTLGRLLVFDGLTKLFDCCTLERPWLNNEPQISCIPTGKYQVVLRTSEKHKEHYHILNVPNRDLILIHIANYVSELRGCVGVGSSFLDINKDGIIDVTSSTATLAGLLQATKKQGFELTII